jgi:hypothetical protein
MLGAFAGMLGIDKKISATIQNTLIELGHELNVGYEDLFVMIQPVDEKFNFEFYVYKIEEGRPVRIREIKLTEILDN